MLATNIVHVRQLTLGSGTRSSSSSSHQFAIPYPARERLTLLMTDYELLTSSVQPRVRTTLYVPLHPFVSLFLHFASASLEYRSQYFLTYQRGMMKVWKPFWYRNLYAGLCGFLCHLGQLENSLHQNHHRSGKILLKVALTLQITWISVVLRLGLESVVIRWSGSSYAHDSIVAVKYGSNSHLFQTRVWGQGGVAHTPHANLSLCLAFTFTFVNEVD